jgi:hypothetical protein
MQSPETWFNKKKKEMSNIPSARKKIVLGVKSFLILLFIGETKLVRPMLQLY